MKFLQFKQQNSVIFCNILIYLSQRFISGMIFFIKISHVQSQKPKDHMKSVLLLAFLFCFSLCLFSDDSAVVKLTQKNFKSLVLESDELWMVEFYAPWCGHCKMSAPQVQKAAQILKGIVNIGAVDMTVQAGAGRGYNIQGYPTIKFFGSDKKNPIDYNSGERTFDKFVEFLMGELKKQVKSRQQDLQNQVEQQL